MGLFNWLLKAFVSVSGIILGAVLLYWVVIWLNVALIEVLL